MDKKELKFYDAPTCEVVELKVEASLLTASIQKPIWGAPEHDEDVEVEE